MKRLIFAVGLALAPLPATANSVGQFDDILLFGDSLSDPGNLFAATVGTVPDPAIYPAGQFTNGDTWATQIGADLASGGNYAFGGAQAAADTDGVPDFLVQIGLWSLSAGPTVSEVDRTIVFLGANDLLADPLNPDPAIDPAIAAIADGLSALMLAGLDDFFVIGLPDLALAPLVMAAAAGTPDPAAALGEVTSAVQQFNTDLQALLAGLPAVLEGLRATLGPVAGANLPDTVTTQYFDSFALFEALSANPGSIGLMEDIGTPCVLPPSLGGSICQDPDKLAFYDPVHWSETVHTAFAEAVSAELAPAPIPLPAGMILALTGLGALGAARRFSRRG